MGGITSAILLHADLSTSRKNSENRNCKAHSLRTVQTAAFLVQTWSICDAQSKWRVGAGPVAAAEIAAEPVVSSGLPSHAIVPKVSAAQSTAGKTFMTGISWR
jgi:hypothetical protein